MFFKRMKRPVAGTVLVTFLSLTLQPLSVLAQDRPQSPASKRQTETGEEKFSRTLNEIHGILKEVVPQAAMPHMFRSGPGMPPSGKPQSQLRAIGPNISIEVAPEKPAPAVDVAKKVSQLRAKAKELASLEAHVREGFAATEQHIKDKNLPAEILARHEEAVRAYEARSAEFKVLLGAVERAADTGGAPLQAALSNLGAFMAKHPNQKTHTPTDPNNLPWGSPKPVTREPYTSPSQFRTSRLFGEPIKLAQAGSLSGISLSSTTLPTSPQPADLAETEDVQLTAAVRAKAAELGNHPVHIYDWVRNNVEFIPSYGSIQGADMTLQSKRGNAFDTASLLIALLRAANIPARYVYGTIEVPANKAMNWVGGVAAPQAAQNLMAQGGIPSVAIGQSGTIRSVRMEHVWVAAYVDYVPSRAAVHRVGDTWVPLDASFKQYDTMPSLDIRGNVPLDAQVLVSQYQQGATVNAQEGWMQNANKAAVSSLIADHQDNIRAFVSSQTSAPKLSDYVRFRNIAQNQSEILYGTLPYTLVAIGASWQAIPDALRWKFRYTVYASDFDRAMESPMIDVLRSTVSLAGKRITLSFVPATPTDTATITSYLPVPHADGTPIDVSELPQSVPGYLIRMIPELRVDGQRVAIGSAGTMGLEVLQSSAYFNPAFGQWEVGETNRPTIGDYTATALDLQGVDSVQLALVNSRMALTKARLEQAESIATVTAEDLAGDSTYAALVSYFAHIDNAAAASAAALSVASYRAPSFGNFSLGLSTRFSYGVPRQVRMEGAVIDIDRVSTIDVSLDGRPDELVAFRQFVGGQFSTAEHMIPERFFRRPDAPPPVGISALRAIELAHDQGQRVYTLTINNVDTILPALAIDPTVKDEIRNAVYAGKNATTHQAPVAVGAWTGVGYVIIDPDTGAGAYKISGGLSGGTATLGATGLATLLAAVVGFTTLFVSLWLVYFLVFAFILAAIIAWLDDWKNPHTEETKLIAIAGLIIATGFFVLANKALLALLLGGLGPAFFFLAFLFALFLIQAYIAFVLTAYAPTNQRTRLAWRKPSVAA